MQLYKYKEPESWAKIYMLSMEQGLNFSTVVGVNTA